MSKEKEQDKKDMEKLEGRPLIKELTAEEIAYKYVHGKHDALTDNQEKKDMAEDVVQFAEAYLKSKQPTVTDEEVRGYIENELGWPIDGTAETNDMITLAKWMRDKLTK